MRITYSTQERLEKPAKEEKYLKGEKVKVAANRISGGQMALCAMLGAYPHVCVQGWSGKVDCVDSGAVSRLLLELLTRTPWACHYENI